MLNFNELWNNILEAPYILLYFFFLFDFYYGNSSSDMIWSYGDKYWIWLYYY